MKVWPTLPDPVLDEVSLSLPAGTAVHIAGRNGVGKTTLLRVIAGLIRPEAGQVRLDGLDPEKDRLAYQKLIGFLPAGDRGLYARLSVRRHFDLWTSISFVPRSEARIATTRAVERFDLGPLLNRRVDRLSMGQRQRVRLAGLLLHGPQMVLVDEPRNSLDDQGIELMADVFRELLDARGSLIWCSPAGESSTFPFDRRFTLDAGRLVQR